METIEAILTRRSIRKYKDQPISDETISLLLKSAMYAPTARNQQPWHFIIIKDKQRLNALAEIHPYGKMLKQAGAAILIAGDITLEITEAYICQDCAAASQNLLLAASDQGLGTVWLGVYPREERMKEISKFLQLPENIIPVSLISVGVPDETKSQPERFLKDRLHFEQW